MRTRKLPRATAVAFAAGALVALTACSAGSADVEGQVTDMEITYLEAEGCNDTATVCKTVQHPQGYKVTVTYHDPATGEARECLYEVDPNTYDEVALGDPVTFAEDDPTGDGCSLASGLAGE